MNKKLIEVIEKDNLEKYIEIQKYETEFNKKHYRYALKNEAQNILLYFILEKDYIEDYNEVICILSNNNSKSVFNKYEDKENFFSRYITKMIRKKRFDDFIYLYEKNLIPNNSYYYNLYARLFFQEKYVTMLKYLVDNTNYNSIEYIIKRSIQLKIYDLLYYIVTEKIIYEFRLDLDDFTIYNVFEYLLYKNERELFRNILKKFVSSQKEHQSKYPLYITNIIYNIELFEVEDIMYILDYEVLDNIIKSYRVFADLLLVQIFKSKRELKFDKMTIIKQIIDKYPHLFYKTVYDFPDIDTRYSLEKYFDTYKILCLYCDDLEYHKHYLDTYRHINDKTINLDLYFVYIFKNPNIEFIREYYDTFKPRILSTMANELYDEDYLWEKDEMGIKQLECYEQKILFLLEHNISLRYSSYNDYGNHIISYIICNIYTNFVIMVDSSRDELLIHLLNFLDEHKIIERFLLPEHYENTKTLDFKFYYSLKNKSIDISFVSYEDNYYRYFIDNLFTRAQDNKIVFNFLKEKYDFTNENILKIIKDEIIKYNIETLNEIISIIGEEKYKTIIQEFEIQAYNIYSMDTFRKLINDGIDLNKSRTGFNGLGLFNRYEENEEDQMEILQIYLDSNYEKKGELVLELYKSDIVSQIELVNYFHYLNEEELNKMYIESLKNKEYYIINWFMKQGFKLKFKDVKKYNLEINFIQFKIQKDIEGKRTCIVCMVNIPSVIIMPCGHLVVCNECSQMITDKCPCDHSTIEKKIYLKGETEEDKYKCNRCNENDIEFIYDKCNHIVCKKCGLKKRCSICFTKSEKRRIFEI